MEGGETACSWGMSVHSRERAGVHAGVCRHAGRAPREQDCVTSGLCQHLPYRVSGLQVLLP